MQPVTEETLILFYYGELAVPEAEGLRARLAGDKELAQRFAALAVELESLRDLPVPERDDQYGRRVWARVDAALDDAPAASALRRFVRAHFSALRPLGGVLAGLLVIAVVAVSAFQLGRMTPAENRVAENATVPGDGYSARLLEASLVNHLSGTERLLTEIANSDATTVDIEAEKDWAQVLLVANRLYRFAAVQAGQHRIAQLLGDMEPVLVELANGAGELRPDEYRALRRSIAERDLLFKVRATNLGRDAESESL